MQSHVECRGESKDRSVAAAALDRTEPVGCLARLHKPGPGSITSVLFLILCISIRRSPFDCGGECYKCSTCCPPRALWTCRVLCPMSRAYYAADRAEKVGGLDSPLAPDYKRRRTYLQPCHAQPASHALHPHTMKQISTCGTSMYHRPARIGYAMGRAQSKLWLGRTNAACWVIGHRSFCMYPVYIPILTIFLTWASYMRLSHNLVGHISWQR